MESSPGLTFRSPWYTTEPAAMPPVVLSQKDISPEIEALKRRAIALLRSAVETYFRRQHGVTSSRFITNILTRGTMSDRISALTLCIRESPVHHYKTVDSALELVSDKNRSHGFLALSSMVDILGEATFLPPDRPLRAFQSQPRLVSALHQLPSARKTKEDELPDGITPTILMLWAFEDWLKTATFKVVQHLEVFCSSNLKNFRTRALDLVYSLLSLKPEQEYNLLRLLANKLHDTDHGVSTHASNLLLQLQRVHPRLKGVVIKVLHSDLICRPCHSLRPISDAINTMNQTSLDPRDFETSELLLHSYLTCLDDLLKPEKKDEDGEKSRVPLIKSKVKPRPVTGSDSSSIEARNKLMCAVLVGIHRALPFLSSQSALQDRSRVFFQLARHSHIQIRIQSIGILHRLSEIHNTGREVFYRLLYSSLLDYGLSTSPRHHVYLTILKQSILKDTNPQRVEGFLKRMGQVIHINNFAFTYSIIAILNDMKRTWPAIKTLLTVPEEQTVVPEKNLNSHVAAACTRPAYDGFHRRAEYANARGCCLWEVAPLYRHYNPKVRKAVTALVGQRDTVLPDGKSGGLNEVLSAFIQGQPLISK